jgi:hypothetical protein
MFNRQTHRQPRMAPTEEGRATVTWHRNAHQRASARPEAPRTQHHHVNVAKFIVWSPQLQSDKLDQAKQHGDDPERTTTWVPSRFFKVVMRGATFSRRRPVP